MEFWEKTRNKNNIALGALEALEKTMKEKTTLGVLEKYWKKKIMALRLHPRKRK